MPQHGLHLGLGILRFLNPPCKQNKTKSLKFWPVGNRNKVVFCSSGVSEPAKCHLHGNGGTFAARYMSYNFDTRHYTSLLCFVRNCYAHCCWSTRALACLLTDRVSYRSNELRGRDSLQLTSLFYKSCSCSVFLPPSHFRAPRCILSRISACR